MVSCQKSRSWVSATKIIRVSDLSFSWTWQVNICPGIPEFIFGSHVKSFISDIQAYCFLSASRECNPELFVSMEEKVALTQVGFHLAFDPKWPWFFRIRWDIFLDHSVLINISLLVLHLILWDLVHLQPLTDMPFWPNLFELSQSIWNLPAGNLVMSLHIDANDEYWRHNVGDNFNFVTNNQCHQNSKIFRDI